MFKLVLEKAEEPEIKLPTSRKNIYFFFIDYAKAFDCVDYNKLENSYRDGSARPPYLPPEKPVMQVKKQQLEMDMEQTGSKLEKAVYCHPAYLTSMQSTSCEMLGWMKHRLE